MIHRVRISLAKDLLFAKTQTTVHRLLNTLDTVVSGGNAEMTNEVLPLFNHLLDMAVLRARRILKHLEYGFADSENSIEFHIRLSSVFQEDHLADLIEKYLVSSVVSFWLSGASIQLDTGEEAAREELKSVALMTDYPVRRKNTF